MADQLCTPVDLANFLDEDIDTARAVLVIEAATAVVQSLVGERIVGDRPAGSQELELARATVLSLAKSAFTELSVVDYEKAYEVAAAEMDASPHWRAALKLQYDRRVALAGMEST